MKHWFTLSIFILGTSLFAQDDSIVVDSSESDWTIFPPTRAKHFFLESDLGYGNSFYTVIGTEYPELVDCRKMHEKNIKEPTAALTAGYQIKNWWNVSVGLQYFQTGFDFSEDKTLSDTLPMEFVIGCEVYQVVDPKAGYVYSGFFDPRFASGILGYHPNHAELNIKLRYHYIGFPLETELSTHLLVSSCRRALKIFVNGGVIPNYMVKQLYYQTYENDSWNYILQDSLGIPSSYIRRWNMSSSFGIGFAFLSRHHFEFCAEFNRQYQLFYLFNWRLHVKDDYQEKHNLSSVRISMRYYFRRR